LQETGSRIAAVFAFFEIANYAACIRNKWSIGAMRRAPFAWDHAPCCKPRERGKLVYQREMVLYTRNRSLRCWRAKRLLDRAGYRFEVVDATADPGALAELSGAAHREVAPPYVFVDRRPVGGMGTVRALVGSGQFERLLRGNL
jgi:glutaredoxin